MSLGVEEQRVSIDAALGVKGVEPAAIAIGQWWVSE